MFTFERPGGSPALRPRQAHAPPPTSDFQGGVEGLADTPLTREQLYTEAKEVLALVSSGPTSLARLSPSPAGSPGNTGPRRPPRSKHDARAARAGPPSAEAHSRLRIGTVLSAHCGSCTAPAAQVMLSKSSPAGAADSAAAVRQERDRVLQEVTRTARQLADLAAAVEEAELGNHLESSLLGAELTGKQAEVGSCLFLVGKRLIRFSFSCQVGRLEAQLRLLREREAELGGRLADWRGRSTDEMAAARARLQAAELALDQLEARHSPALTTDQEMELLEQIKKSHEILEAERRVFEVILAFTLMA